MTKREIFKKTLRNIAKNDVDRFISKNNNKKLIDSLASK